MSQEINTDWLNKKINSLFEEYSRNKKNGIKVEITIRNKKAEEVIEIYFKEHKQLPDALFIDRLATYILLDELSDNSTNKTQTTEYNILSEKQEKRRKLNELLLPDVFYDTSISHGKGTSAKNFTTNIEEIQVHEHQHIFEAITQEVKDNETELMFFTACHGEFISNIDTYILYQVIFNEKTLRSLENELRLKRTAITDRYNKSMEKLQKSKFLYNI